MSAGAGKRQSDALDARRQEMPQQDAARDADVQGIDSRPRGVVVVVVVAAAGDAPSGHAHEAGARARHERAQPAACVTSRTPASSRESSVRWLSKACLSVRTSRLNRNEHPGIQRHPYLPNPEREPCGHRSLPYVAPYTSAVDLRSRRWGCRSPLRRRRRSLPTPRPTRPHCRRKQFLACRRCRRRPLSSPPPRAPRRRPPVSSTPRLSRRSGAWAGWPSSRWS